MVNVVRGPADLLVHVSSPNEYEAIYNQAQAQISVAENPNSIWLGKNSKRSKRN